MRVRMRRTAGITLAVGRRQRDTAGTPDRIVGMSPFGSSAPGRTGSPARSATLIRRWHGTV
jgi:hypothetical protein